MKLLGIILAFTFAVLISGLPVTQLSGEDMIRAFLPETDLQVSNVGDSGESESNYGVAEHGQIESLQTGKGKGCKCSRTKPCQHLGLRDGTCHPKLKLWGRMVCPQGTAECGPAPSPSTCKRLRRKKCYRRPGCTYHTHLGCVPSTPTTSRAPVTAPSTCGRHDANDCKAEHANAVRNRNLMAFYNRCQREAAFRGRCSKCCSTPSPPTAPPRVFTFAPDSCGGRADVSVLVDASASVNSREWALQAKFTKGIIQGMGIGLDNVQYGVTVFGNRAKTLLALTDDGSKAAALPFDHSRARRSWNVGRGQTNMALAFDLADKMLTPSKRPVPKIVLMITDGAPTDRRQAEPLAKRLMDKGYTIIMILVGSGVSKRKIAKMVTSLDLALVVKSFSELPNAIGTINRQLAAAVCEAEKSLPPSTQTPSTRRPTSEPSEPTAPPLPPATAAPTAVPTAAPTSEPSEPTAPPLPPATAAPTAVPSEPTSPPIPTCPTGECYCTSAGGDTCEGATCAADGCIDANFCDGGGYWCAGKKLA